MRPVFKGIVALSGLLLCLACASCAQEHNAAGGVEAAQPAPASAQRRDGPTPLPPHTLATSTAARQEVPMKTFVLIFRRQGRVLSEQEKKQQTDEVRAWARGVNAAGAKLDPRILGDDAYRWAEQGKGEAGAVTAGGAVSALLFLEAADLDEAARIANEHPGLRYGATVEVRPWAAPAAPAIAPR